MLVLGVRDVISKKLIPNELYAASNPFVMFPRSRKAQFVVSRKAVAWLALMIATSVAEKDPLRAVLTSNIFEPCPC
ncbi:MAG: hypothetical protein RMK18_00765 [Armatimonadota bacterium]|nr:hypothetical protein [Armatimonadota bacterium]MCX7777297.1 hypothetical protein [Armatimonadota bacterium]MDW8024386.1 hypothetical protein [Armatimonadota bacterium]